MNTAAEFLKGLPLIVFVFAAGMPAIMAALSAGIGLWARRTAKLLGAAQPVSPAQAAPGYRLVQGWVEEGANLKAPLTGRRCAWFSSRVQEARRTQKSDCGGYRWQRLNETISEKPFVLRDGAASLRVDPGGAAVFANEWSEWHGREMVPQERDPARQPGREVPGGAGRIEVLGPGRFRYRESYIYPGDPVFVLGDVRQNGKQGLLIGRPVGRRAFLISTRSPAEITAESRMALRGGLMGAVVFGGLALFVIVLRFG